MRLAYVLHGKLGAINRGTGPSRAVDGAVPGLDLLVMCFASIYRHVIAANPDFSVDLIGHSWSPSVGPAIDALFKPRLSAHENEEVARNRLLCSRLDSVLRRHRSAANLSYTRFAPVGRGTSSCERTASHILGVQRAILLKAERGGFKYDLVILARWDVMWNRPLALQQIHTRASPTREPEVTSGTLALSQASGGKVPTAARSCTWLHRPCIGDLSPEAREVFLLDWWFASSSAAADRFADVGSEKVSYQMRDGMEFAHYTVLNFVRLTNSNSPTMMGHAFWGMKMLWGLSAPLHFRASFVGLDFTLGRMWEVRSESVERLAIAIQGVRILRPRCSPYPPASPPPPAHRQLREVSQDALTTLGTRRSGPTENTIEASPAAHSTWNRTEAFGRPFKRHDDTGTNSAGLGARRSGPTENTTKASPHSGWNRSEAVGRHFKSHGASGSDSEGLRACGAADVVTRPWQRALVHPPVREAPTFRASFDSLCVYRYNAWQTSASCDDGWFTCDASSRAFLEQLEAVEPMDRTRERALWIGCTNKICQRMRLSQNSPQCAGALLKIWTQRWSSASPANYTLAEELQLAG
ncbi:MAG: hypothetical protein SGPRY_004859 [Prymnesium sp.]